MIDISELHDLIDTVLLEAYEPMGCECPPEKHESTCTIGRLQVARVELARTAKAHVYLAKQGNQCPECGSKNVDEDEIRYSEDESGIGELLAWCCDCNHHWFDIYQLVDYREVDEHDSDLVEVGEVSYA